jgi:hypothetical protein
MIYKQKGGTKIILVVGSRPCFWLQPMPIKHNPWAYYRKGQYFKQGWVWIERSSDGSNVMAMNQSLFVVITHTHFYTFQSNLFYNKFDGSLFPCWVIAKRKNHILTEPYFLLMQKTLKMSLSASRPHNKKTQTYDNNNNNNNNVRHRHQIICFSLLSLLLPFFLFFIFFTFITFLTAQTP